MQQADRFAAYLATLDVAVSDPTFAFLVEVIRSHQARLAFTSIGPQLGDDLPLDLDSVFNRVVTRKRGGYCFEHNLLLFDVLVALGFECRLLMARVVLHGDDAPLDHRVTLVTLPDGDAIVDVGMGWPSPTVPVPMSGDVTGDGWRSFRIVESRPGHFTMQSSRGVDWKSLYRFELHEYGDVDCEVAHFFTSRSPESQFTQHVIASLSMPGEIRSLRDATYQVITPDSTVDTAVTDATHLRVLLASELGVAVTSDEADRLWRSASS